MDDIDKKILKRLQENARVTISVLSSEISLSMPAISERLKKLEASGVIKQYTAILNPELVDKQLMALVYLSFDNPSHGDSFKNFVVGESDIKECFYITGDFDYSLKIITQNTTTLENLLTRIKEQTGVIKTQTIVVLSSIIDRPSVTVE
ncbi:MAG: Lrp/AsnC family transcriptional regulator [Anaerovibrio sp.]|uniref:Lrp/AsnC family transcriptional regulator n=1 Tax=Anaerovibrio lipolyticus TaxID=82374 RepID=UPI0023F0A547|nr:Lrp/AsnC family transcriptional regulator [Anaerovibrio lipolyticus]MBQ1856168.1 Lrp/AsnC family transcriptional regulator [Anaerovibrio sp.]